MDWPKEILIRQGMYYFTPPSVLRKTQKKDDFEPLACNPPFKQNKPY